MFVISNNTWVDITESATLPPGGRNGHGFTSDGSWLYVHAGETQNGMYLRA